MEILIHVPCGNQTWFAGKFPDFLKMIFPSEPPFGLVNSQLAMFEYRRVMGIYGNNLLGTEYFIGTINWNTMGIYLTNLLEMI